MHTIVYFFIIALSSITNGKVISQPDLEREPETGMVIEPSQPSDDEASIEISPLLFGANDDDRILPVLNILDGGKLSPREWMDIIKKAFNLNLQDGHDILHLNNVDDFEELDDSSYEDWDMEVLQPSQEQPCISEYFTTLIPCLRTVNASEEEHHVKSDMLTSCMVATLNEYAMCAMEQLANNSHHVQDIINNIGIYLELNAENIILAKNANIDAEYENL